MNAAAIIERYYRHIDACELDAVVDLFAQDAVYDRAGVRFEGKEQIAHFFREQRLIRGTHILEDVVCWGDRSLAIGRFEGVGAEGDPRSVAFVDVWQFDPCGLARERRTFLASGYDLVER